MALNLVFLDVDWDRYFDGLLDNYFLEHRNLDRNMNRLRNMNDLMNRHGYVLGYLHGNWNVFRYGNGDGFIDRYRYVLENGVGDGYGHVVGYGNGLRHMNHFWYMDDLGNLLNYGNLDGNRDGVWHMDGVRYWNKFMYRDGLGYGHGFGHRYDLVNVLNNLMYMSMMMISTANAVYCTYRQNKQYTQPCLHDIFI